MPNMAKYPILSQKDGHFVGMTGKKALRNPTSCSFCRDENKNTFPKIPLIHVHFVGIKPDFLLLHSRISVQTPKNEPSDPERHETMFIL